MYALIEAATQQEHQRTAAASTSSPRRSICPSLTRSSRMGYYASGSPRFTITPTSSAGDSIAMNVEHESRSPLPQSSPQPPDPVHLPPSSVSPTSIDIPLSTVPTLINSAPPSNSPYLPSTEPDANEHDLPPVDCAGGPTCRPLSV
ncbi:hypothetical protein EW146_g10100 [Bondarzewia mesenterica]|uniref:Uncharacterized protein n=1 Tax=Bondarzewia mesenterica TaxID=1095465 RepID=A0A4S4L0G6_9AGAM|nr:hypothetical protein EW146_g10100 [Bondarzewia mesenterica]